MSDPDQKSDDEGGSLLDDGGVDTDERAGRSLGIKPDEEPDEDTKREMDEERERRLDPENRPDGAEIDNTGRTFDAEAGMFTDNDDYDGAEKPFDDPENPNSDDDEADDSHESDESDDSASNAETDDDHTSDGDRDKADRPEPESDESESGDSEPESDEDAS